MVDITVDTGINPTTQIGVLEVLAGLVLNVEGINPTTQFDDVIVTFGGDIIVPSIEPTTKFGSPGVFITDLDVEVIDSPKGRTYTIYNEDRVFKVLPGNNRMKFIEKDPQAILNYSFDLSDWLEDDDTIASFVLTKSTNINLVSQDATQTKITAVVSGGAQQGQESLVCNFTTVNGYSDDRTIVFQMQNR